MAVLGGYLGLNLDRHFRDIEVKSDIVQSRISGLVHLINEKVLNIDFFSAWSSSEWMNQGFEGV